MSAVGQCFSENYSRYHEGFKLIIDGVYGAFFINLMTTLTLKMKKIGVLGANKSRQTVAGHDLGKNLFK